MTRWHWATGAALAALIATNASHAIDAAPAGATRVVTEGGTVVGAAARGMVTFKGIPYAQAPVGELRWRPPQPVLAWSGERDGTVLSPDCMQSPFGAPPPAGRHPIAEDCLYLNIWKPTTATTATTTTTTTTTSKLPVMVWIHGGGFVNGGSSSADGTGEGIARRGVMFVNFNYRLGRFGFFAHPALEPHANYGLMDQIAALQWVKRNIASFGGDADNVTLVGESAGGMSINLLLTSPAAQGLFQRAIVQSGAGRKLPSERYLDEDLPNAISASSMGVQFAKRQGVDGNDAKALRALSANQVTDGLSMFSLLARDAALFPGPVIDGKLVLHTPEVRFAGKRFKPVPLMIGATSQDLGFNMARTPEEAFAPFGEFAAEARAAYDPNGKGDMQAINAAIAGDRAMVEPARFIARAVAAAGAPVYEYRFSYTMEASRAESPNGAQHATDVPYAFDLLDAVHGNAVRPADRQMAATMADYWANFARNGNPNGAGLPEWPRYSADKDQLMDFGADGRAAAQADPWKQRLDLTERINPPYSAKAAKPNVALMPWPAAITPGTAAASSTQAAFGAVAVAGGFVVDCGGACGPAVSAAAARFAVDVRKRMGVYIGKPALPLRLNVRAPGVQARGAGEAYKLAVAADGVTIDAANQSGLLRGLATLRQLLRNGRDGFELPLITIRDQPRYAWRGVLIDVARHFISLPTLQRQIDAMEAVKLNVLHLHLSDNEAFRIESKRYPRLTQVAARGGFYTQAEIKQLVAYAHERGILVVPEFDVPGHTGAILTAYPEYSRAPVRPDDPIAIRGVALNPLDARTYTFVETLFKEMAALFPGEYFHIGGDEVSPQAWKDLDHKKLEAHFAQRVIAIVEKLGKTTMGWEEILHRELKSNVVLQAWRSSQATAHTTAHGNRTVVSAGYYLDLLRPGEQYYAIDPTDLFATPPDRPADLLGPAPQAPLSEKQQALILGGEVTAWAEVITDEMLDGRLWPRAALMAERFWSSAQTLDANDAMRRAIIVQDNLRIDGLADAQQRYRMAARLSPGDAGPVVTLAAATAPIRNFGRMSEVIAAARRGEPVRLPELNAMVDIAAPDSVEMYCLRTLVESYINGGDAAALRAELATYRDNHDRFVAIAKGRRALEDAVPISADVAALATTGLEAIDLIERQAAPTAAWRTNAVALLRRQDDAAAASSSIMKALSGAKQPPAMLLTGLTPAIRRLVESL